MFRNQKNVHTRPPTRNELLLTQQSNSGTFRTSGRSLSFTKPSYSSAVPGIQNSSSLGSGRPVGVQNWTRRKSWQRDMKQVTAKQPYVQQRMTQASRRRPVMSQRRGGLRRSSSKFLFSQRTIQYYHHAPPPMPSLQRKRTMNTTSLGQQSLFPQAHPAPGPSFGFTQPAQPAPSLFASTTTTPAFGQPSTGTSPFFAQTQHPTFGAPSPQQAGLGGGLGAGGGLGGGGALFGGVQQGQGFGSGLGAGGQQGGLMGQLTPQQRSQMAAQQHHSEVVSILKGFQSLTHKELDQYLQLYYREQDKLQKTADYMKQEVSKEVRQIAPEKVEGLRERIRDLGRRNKQILGKMMAIHNRIEQITINAGRVEKRPDKEVEYYKKISEVKFKLGEAQTRLAALREKRGRPRARVAESEEVPPQIMKTMHKSIEFLKKQSELDREDMALIRKLQ